MNVVKKTEKTINTTYMHVECVKKEDFADYQQISDKCFCSTNRSIVKEKTYYLLFSLVCVDGKKHAALTKKGKNYYSFGERVYPKMVHESECRIIDNRFITTANV